MSRICGRRRSGVGGEFSALARATSQPRARTPAPPAGNEGGWQKSAAEKMEEKGERREKKATKERAGNLHPPVLRQLCTSTAHVDRKHEDQVQRGGSARPGAGRRRARNVGCGKSMPSCRVLEKLDGATVIHAREKSCSDSAGRCLRVLSASFRADKDENGDGMATTTTRGARAGRLPFQVYNAPIFREFRETRLYNPGHPEQPREPVDLVAEGTAPSTMSNDQSCCPRKLLEYGELVQIIIALEEIRRLSQLEGALRIFHVLKFWSTGGVQPRNIRNQVKAVEVDWATVRVPLRLGVNTPRLSGSPERWVPTNRKDSKFSFVYTFDEVLAPLQCFQGAASLPETIPPVIIDNVRQSTSLGSAARWERDTNNFRPVLFVHWGRVSNLRLPCGRAKEEGRADTDRFRHEKEYERVVLQTCGYAQDGAALERRKIDRRQRVEDRDGQVPETSRTAPENPLREHALVEGAVGVSGTDEENARGERLRSLSSTSPCQTAPTLSTRARSSEGLHSARCVRYFRVLRRLTLEGTKGIGGGDMISRESEESADPSFFCMAGRQSL
ncbi:hypothetical protein FB451DRAFT_1368521, partial [Mycena latifolia]